MDSITLILIALSLSADAFAVAVTNGICSKRTSKCNLLSTAFTFGFLQGLMPMLGFALGKGFSDLISRYQHFVALFLLAAIGINMLVEAVKEGRHPENSMPDRSIFSAKNLLLQGIATSIDALAIGVSFSALQVNILFASILIGAVTFFCCAFGVYIGKRFGKLLGVRARLIGGILLLLIGLRIFFENLKQ